MVGLRFGLLLLAVYQSSAAVISSFWLNGTMPYEDIAQDFFYVPFEMPAGVQEVEVYHPELNKLNIFDWGLNDTRGFRGWGGGNVENIVVGVRASSRSYLTGPILPGTWSVVVGKAQVVQPPQRYTLLITLRDAQTLKPQPERSVYRPSPPLKKGPAWFAGDFHVHSLESGDARPSLDAIAEYATKQARLDFVEISDHNTNSSLDFFNDVQARWKELLFVPGVEYTTYRGHGNGIGATQYVDHKIGVGGLGIVDVVKQFHKQGAVFAINHATIDWGLAVNCIGCKWEHTRYLPMEMVDAMEIGIGSWETQGQIFIPPAIKWWDQLEDAGYHITAIGGSDDHQGGKDPRGIAIGKPTTMVLAADLSARSIVAGVKAGRTVIKFHDYQDPMVILDFAAPLGPLPLDSSTVLLPSSGVTSVALTVTVQGHATYKKRPIQMRLLQDGAVAVPFFELPVTADPFTQVFTVQLAAPKQKYDGRKEWRFRAEVYEMNGLVPVTITSHVYARMP